MGKAEAYVNIGLRAKATAREVVALFPDVRDAVSRTFVALGALDACTVGITREEFVALCSREYDRALAEVVGFVADGAIPQRLSDPE